MKKFLRVTLIVIASIFALSLLAIDRNAPMIDSFIEEDIVLEDWMTEPFNIDDTAFYEADIEVEDWMTRPLA